LAEAVRDGRIPDDDLVRAELYRRLGYYPTESSEHHAEYNPWFIPKGLVERYHVPIGEYLRRISNNLAEYDETKRRLAAGEPFEIERSGEYAAVIINSVVTGELARIVGNVPNRGALIPNLAADACVEVPCLVDTFGPRPIAPGPLPPHLAAYIHPAVDAQGLTVRALQGKDRDAIYHAVMQDPLVQAHLSLDETWQMTDELISAEAAWMPAWLGGTASA
jgi:alpha-galactosidase